MQTRALAVFVLLRLAAWGGEPVSAVAPSPVTPVSGPSVTAASGSGWEQWHAALPSWLDLSGELRGRFESYLGWNGVPGHDNTYYLDRLRVNTTVGWGTGCGWWRKARIREWRATR